MWYKNILIFLGNLEIINFSRIFEFISLILSKFLIGLISLTLRYMILLVLNDSDHINTIKNHRKEYSFSVTTNITTMTRAVKCVESEDVEDVEAEEIVNQDIETIEEKIHNLEDAIQRFGRFTSILENPKVKKAIAITMVILAFTVGVFFLLQYKILGITTSVLLTGIELWLVNYSHKRDFDLPQNKNELRILKKQRDAMESQF